MSLYYLAHKLRLFVCDIMARIRYQLQTAVAAIVKRLVSKLLLQSNIMNAPNDCGRRHKKINKDNY